MPWSCKTSKMSSRQSLMSVPSNPLSLPACPQSAMARVQHDSARREAESRAHPDRTGTPISFSTGSIQKYCPHSPLQLKLPARCPRGRRRRSRRRRNPGASDLLAPDATAPGAAHEGDRDMACRPRPHLPQELQLRGITLHPLLNEGEHGSALPSLSVLLMGRGQSRQPRLAVPASNQQNHDVGPAHARRDRPAEVPRTTLRSPRPA